MHPFFLRQSLYDANANDVTNDNLPIRMLVNSNVVCETSFPVSVAFTPASLPSKQTAQAATEHKQEVNSLNLKFS